MHWNLSLTDSKTPVLNIGNDQAFICIKKCDANICRRKSWKTGKSYSTKCDANVYFWQEKERKRKTTDNRMWRYIKASAQTAFPIIHPLGIFSHDSLHYSLIIPQQRGIRSEKWSQTYPHEFSQMDAVNLQWIQFGKANIKAPHFKHKRPETSLNKNQSKLSLSVLALLYVT